MIRPGPKNKLDGRRTVSLSLDNTTIAKLDRVKAKLKTSRSDAVRHVVAGVKIASVRRPTTKPKPKRGQQARKEAD